MRLRSISIRAGAVSAVGLTALAVLAGPADASDAGTLVSDTNALRAAHGLTAYRVCPDLDSIADGWAAHLAATGSLAHNPDLANEMAGWDDLAENVGEGGSAAAVETSFEQSSDHLANLESPSYEEVGIGTARSKSGTLWVDEVFRRPSGAACAGSAAPAPVATATRTVSGPTPVAPSRRVTAAPRSATGSSPAASGTTPAVRVPPAALARQQLAAAQRAALRVRLRAAAPPTNDVVGDALAFASLLRPAT